MTVHQWKKQVRIVSATLLTPIHLEFINTMCNVINNNLVTTTQTMFQIVFSKDFPRLLQSKVKIDHSLED